MAGAPPQRRQQARIRKNKLSGAATREKGALPDCRGAAPAETASQKDQKNCSRLRPAQSKLSGAAIRGTGGVASLQGRGPSGDRKPERSEELLPAPAGAKQLQSAAAKEKEAFNF